MKKIFTYIFLIFALAGFSFYIYKSQISNEVIDIITPTKIVIDTNHNKQRDSDEIYCVDNVESFSLEPSEDFINKHIQKLSKIDDINLGFLANEYAQKTLLHQNVQIEETTKITAECKYANIKINGLDYKDLLLKSGFGIDNGKIFNEEKFKQHFQKSKKLNLVVLNHHSNKYHTLECEYGNLAHDKVIIPFKQLPKGMKPCKFCHKTNPKKTKKTNKTILSIPNIPSPSLTHTSGNISLYYTDFTKHLKPDKNCATSECRTFVKLVNEAKDSIDIAIYGYDEVPAITYALKKAKERGVKIRFVYDTTSNKGNSFYQDNSKIKELSTEINTDFGKENGYIMHNKFIIFDRQKVFTGSMNFSKTGLSGYDENDILIINSASVSELYEKEFNQMISGKFHNAKISHGNNHFQIGDTTLEIYFSPQDKSSHRVVDLINNANNYIYLPTFLITHKDITNALIQANKRGIDVKIIMDANNTSTRNTKHLELRKSGIPLKIENYAGKLHSKTIIIDDKYIVMGSMNFSNSGENKNDENLIVITNTQFAKSYKEFFNYLWRKIPDKYLKYYPKAESPDSIGSCTDGVDNNFNGKIDFLDEGCK